MSGRHALFNRTMGRVAVSLLAVATMTLLAPTAAATPETDANNAITATWQASGGDTGPLGPPNGGVYPIGEGFGQNFAGGKIFFTPATGARVMQGAILEKYESLGGPADSDLGFPTIDEGPGLAPGSRNSTFSAGDNPVIFWTPGTGARVVRGPINAAWDRLGGSSGALGVPAEDAVYDGDTVRQKFTAGELTWNRKTREFSTVPPELGGQLAGLQIPDDPAAAIEAARRAAGGPLGPLGERQGEQYPVGDNGIAQDFTGGKIFYTPVTGANVLTGQVLEKYESVGGPEGELGFPTSSEQEGGLGPNSRIATFAGEDQPVIFWTPDYGAVIVRGAMNAAWSKLDRSNGPLGAPMADQTEDGNVVTQRFSGGAISWDRGTNEFSTEPANLSSELSGLEIPGYDPGQAPSSPQASDPDEGKWFEFRWQWWWLLAVIPVLLLAGLIIGAAAWNRRRDRGEDPFEAEFAALKADGGSAFGAAPSAAGPQTGADDEATAKFAGPFAGPQTSSTFDWGAPRDVTPRAPESWGYQPETEDTAREAESSERETGFADAEYELFGARQDPDTEDTAPTRIESEPSDAIDEPSVPAEQRDIFADDVYADESEDEFRSYVEEADTSGAETEGQPDEFAAETPLFVEESPSGRHAAISIDEPTPGRTAIHLPLDDPYEPPEGYPVKADTASGLYWAPTSQDYDEVAAEIWFASEELARTNGFVRADQ